MAKQADATAIFQEGPGVRWSKFKFALRNLFCSRALCLSCDQRGYTIGQLAMKWGIHSNGPSSVSVGRCVFDCQSRLLATILSPSHKGAKMLQILPLLKASEYFVHRFMFKELSHALLSIQASRVPDFRNVRVAMWDRLKGQVCTNSTSATVYSLNIHKEG